MSFLEPLSKIYTRGISEAGGVYRNFKVTEDYLYNLRIGSSEKH